MNSDHRNEESQKEFDALASAVSSSKRDGRFAEAREKLDQALRNFPEDSDAYIWIQQQRALCTYKDHQLRPEAKFKEALAILKEIGLLDPKNNDPETLGLGGAIYKRMWEYYGNYSHLMTSLAFYLAGWERFADADLYPPGIRHWYKKRDLQEERGYCGINAAYVYDVMAFLHERAVHGIRPRRLLADVKRWRLRSTSLRRVMLARLPDANDSDYWSLVTRAELYFGLDKFEKAGYYLRLAKRICDENWKLQTTIEQLLNLARWRQVIETTALGASFVAYDDRARQCRDALRELVGDAVEPALGRYRGKVGLALSGGGFRAAFFHLGVLARLAEIDVLRHVEVLSTVSGGSIVGTHYYLELKQLLEKKPDQSLVREDYIVLVARIQDLFLKGVQRNLRMRIFASLRKNWKMMVTGDFTRGKRIGELYEEEIYARIGDGNSGQADPIMSDLLIRPNGYSTAEDFNPREQNWLRHAKVPELVLNSTSLNSGHNFQFTGSWMGEPPGLTGAEVDMNLRHRRLYYGEAPTGETAKFRLGYAVAASSCVPGLFDPLEIRGLYPGRTIKLVDGGVHDNQGTCGLLNQDCDFIFCSDASGQMHDEANPAGDFLRVPLRANDILQDRVRESEFDCLRSMAESGRLKGLFFIHLKKDLAQEDIGFIGCVEKQPEQQGNQTPYGIDRDIQRRLSELRTDLDSFSEVEAHALMLSGYQMAEEHARALDAKYRDDGGVGSWGGFDNLARRGDWPFFRIAAIAGKPCDSSDLRRMDLEKQLAVGKDRTFKVLKLMPSLLWVKRITIFAVLAGLAGGLYLLWQHRSNPEWSVSYWSIALLVITAVLSFVLPWWVFPKKAVRERLIRICLAAVSWLGVWFHLLIMDPLFLRRGRVNRLLRLPAEGK